MEIFSHEYYLGIYGVFLWNILWLAFENKVSKMSFKRFWNENKFIVLASLAVMPLCVVFDDELIQLMKDVTDEDRNDTIEEFHEMVYLSAGFITNLILGIGTKLFRITQKK